MREPAMREPAILSTRQISRDRNRRFRRIAVSVAMLLLFVAVFMILLVRSPFLAPGLLAFIPLSTVAIASLLVMIARNLVKLYFQQHSRFRSRLVMAFVLTAMMPTALLAIFGTGILNQTINQWFNPRLEDFLNEAKSIADRYQTQERDRLYAVGAVLLQQIGAADPTSPQVETLLREALVVYAVSAAQLYDAEKIERLVVSAPGLEVPAEFYRKPSTVLDAAQSTGEPSYSHRPEGKLGNLFVALPLDGGEGDLPRGYLVLRKAIPPELYEKVRQLSAAVQQYQKLQYQTGGLRLAYLLIFVAMALLLLFTAIWFGTNIAKEIAVPVQALAEATQQVAEGDLKVRVDLEESNEFGTLVRAFNDMTRQLDENKAAIELANSELIDMNRELATKQSYIQTLIEDIPNGVVSIDHEGRITTLNHRAGVLLRLNPAEVLGRNAAEVFNTPPIDRLRFWVDQMHSTQEATLKRQLTLNRGEETNLYLDVTVSSFQDPRTESLGYIIVIEDLSELLKAQRAAAWQEVARRIAHEIKNPLTPISLAAQRVKKRCLGEEYDREGILGSSMKIILEGIDEIQQLVNEFSSFARMPQANPEPNDLHELINNTVSLYDGLFPEITFQLDLYPNMPPVALDLEQMRRALRNIIDNGIEAMGKVGTVRISTAHDPLFQMVRIVIADEGVGVPAEDREKLFQPYFSTKGDKGTGLGLAIVNKIISDHNGYIRMKENHPKGSRVIIELPTGYSVSTSWR